MYDGRRPPGACWWSPGWTAGFCLYVYLSLSLYIYIYIYMFMICVYIYIYTHTYTCIYTDRLRKRPQAPTRTDVLAKTMYNVHA